jgi:hypothetical protein
MFPHIYFNDSIKHFAAVHIKVIGWLIKQKEIRLLLMNCFANATLAFSHTTHTFIFFSTSSPLKKKTTKQVLSSSSVFWLPASSFRIDHM